MFSVDIVISFKKKYRILNTNIIYVLFIKLCNSTVEYISTYTILYQSAWVPFNIEVLLRRKKHFPEKSNNKSIKVYLMNLTILHAVSSYIILLAFPEYFDNYWNYRRVHILLNIYQNWKKKNRLYYYYYLFKSKSIETSVYRIYAF